MAGDSEVGPPPLPPPPLAPQAPAPPSGPNPAHQKLALYAGGALVVLIVLVIMAVSPRKPAIELVPRGQTLIQVVDVRRFLDSPVYQTLANASHHTLEPLFEAERRFEISLQRDVATVVDTEDSTILIGRFRPERLRDCFEEGIETREKEINRGRASPVKLDLREEQVDGYRYAYCKQEGVDHAFAAVGSSIVCFGERWGVRRFLKTRAGQRGTALDDDHFAAAYSPELARRAFLYRLEKPGGLLVASKLKEVLGDAGEGIQAAFFALAVTRKDVELAVRFVVRDARAAEKLEVQLSKASTQVALRRILGSDAAPRVTRANAVVTLESAIPLDSLDELVEKDKRGQGSSLILTLIAS